MEDQEANSTEPSVGATLKVAISSGAIIFAVGAIFWAGGTYAQIGEIQKQLTIVSTRLAVLETVPVLQHDVEEHDRRLQKLEDYIRRNP